DRLGQLPLEFGSVGTDRSLHLVQKICCQIGNRRKICIQQLCLRLAVLQRTKLRQRSLKQRAAGFGNANGQCTALQGFQVGRLGTKLAAQPLFVALIHALASFPGCSSISWTLSGNRLRRSRTKVCPSRSRQPNWINSPPSGPAAKGDGYICCKPL